MKIEQKLFSDFINKVSFGETVEQAILNFDKDGVKAKVVSCGLCAMGDLFLSKSAFFSYEPIGKIGIKNVKRFCKIIDRFKKEISMSTTKNVIAIREGNRKSVISIAEPDFIEEAPEVDLDALPFKASYTFGLQELVDVSRDLDALKIEGDKASKGYVIFEAKGGYLTVKSEVYEDETILRLKIASQESVKTKIQEHIFKPMIKSLSTDKVIMKLGADIPIMFVENRKELKAMYFLSPMVDDEEETEASETEAKDVEVKK